MKRITIFIIMMFMLGLYAQENKKSIKDKYKNVATLKSDEVKEVKVEDLKPDNSALLGKKDSPKKAGLKRHAIENFKKSNKLLY